MHIHLVMLSRRFPPQAGNYMNHANVTSFLEAESAPKPEPVSDASPAVAASSPPPPPYPGTMAEAEAAVAAAATQIAGLALGNVQKGSGSTDDGRATDVADAARAGSPGVDIDDDRRPEFQVRQLRHSFGNHLFNIVNTYSFPRARAIYTTPTRAV